MKILKLLLAMCATSFTILSCGSKKAESQKILVLYYSQNGTTEKVAQEIAGKLVENGHSPVFTQVLR